MSRPGLLPGPVARSRTPLALQHLPALVDPACCQRWLAEIEAALDAAAAVDVVGRPAATADGPAGAASPMQPVRPCSLPLSALPVLFDELLHRLSAHPRLTPWLDAALGPRRVLLADHCFVRHQPAPRHRQAGQHPHSWHQDGALGFDFIRHAEPPYPPDALAPMAICWLTLTPCGAGTAPSLAWVTPPLDHLWPLPMLNDAAIERELAQRSGPVQALHTAELATGDALVFGGGTLHRTHATDAMVQARTSVELRWLPADGVPLRLASGRLPAA